MRKTIILLLLGLFAHTGWAQHTVSGTITDSKTGETLIGATVYDTVSKKGTVTNQHGRYTLTLKDAKAEVKKLIKPQKNVKIPVFSPRAKKMLEIAYETAQQHKRTKIKSENILYGITKMPNCLAMKVLSNLGTDILELQQGIKQELLGGMEL